MLKHGWTVVCERAIVDEKSGSVSLINCLEQINTPGFPVLVSRFFIVSFWYEDGHGRADKNRVHLKFTLEQPSHEDHMIGALEAITDKPRHRVIIEVGGLVLERAGTYHLRIDRKIDESWKVITRLPLDVVEKVTQTETGQKPGVKNPRIAHT